MRKRRVLFSILLFNMIFVFSTLSSRAENKDETKTLRILATSDLHGKFVPWDYALNEENTSGSMTQLSTAISEYRNDASLLVDAGDTIQDNFADYFNTLEGVHPMIQAVNALDYDIWVPGNHEYNFGMDILRKTISDMDCKVLTGNVYDENGDPVADGYTILEKNGIRVAVIGMVTPNIARWDAVNLADCTVTDPLEETRRIIDAISGQYDVLLGVYHMSVGNEYDVPHSGVEDILNACPEFDVMVASHEHIQIPGLDINGTLVVENKNMAQTMAVIDLTLVRDGDRWKITDKTSESINISGYEPDPVLTGLLKEYDEQARAYAVQPIGELTGGPLAPENEFSDIPAALVQDTALLDLVQRVQMYYADAPVSASALTSPKANLYPGTILRYDMSNLYRYTNTLYKLHMTGAQLKKYMEWSVSFYNTYRPGDLTISFRPDINIFNYDMFEGVNYEINISKEPGSRIENLTWPDGNPVKDEDEFDFATYNYRAESHLLVPGVIYEEDDMPILIESDIHSEIGGIRELIGEYIIDVKGGSITPECSSNWKITGCDWDPDPHREAADLVKKGLLSVPSSEDGHTVNIRAITEEDVYKASAK